MRRLALAMLFVAVAGSARTGAGATIQLNFENSGLPLQQYVISAKGDTFWWALNFAIDVSNSLSGLNPVFDLSFGVPSGLNTSPPFVGTHYDLVRANPAFFAPNQVVPIGVLTLAVAGGLGPAGTHTLANLDGSAGLFAIRDPTPFTNAHICLDGAPCNVPGTAALLVTIGIPEPTTLGLLAAGLAGLALLGGRRAG